MFHSQTKIVATIGPASAEGALMGAMIEAGASVFRLNFSHGTADEHRLYIHRLRAAAKRQRRTIMIFGDLPGPKIRLGPVAPSPITLHAGQSFFLTSRAGVGSAEGASISYRRLARDVKPGDTIALSDGAVLLRVQSIAPPAVQCVVEIGGEIASHRGVNFPQVRLSTAALTAADRRWIRFAVEEDLDALALSFVRHARDIRQARHAIESAGGDLPVIAKIEKHEAVENLAAIVDEADAAMAARGDLGIEVPLEYVPEIQKRLLRLCNRAAKPVITATQMLESMIHSARPTRAEVSDIANAILDGSDAVMLSGESAIGAYPLAAVRVMARVAGQTNHLVHEVDWLHEFAGCRADCPDEAISHSVFRIAERIGARAIVCLTASGLTARRVARYRPPIPVIAFSDRRATLRRLQLSWGVRTLAGLEGAFHAQRPSEDVFARATALVRRAGLLKSGEKAVAVAGVPLHQEGITNLIRVIEA